VHPQHLLCPCLRCAWRCKHSRFWAHIPVLNTSAVLSTMAFSNLSDTEGEHFDRFGRVYGESASDDSDTMESLGHVVVPSSFTPSLRMSEMSAREQADQILNSRASAVMSRTRSADKTTQLNHSYSLKCESILSSTSGIAQLLHSDSLLMTGRMKVRGTNPAKGTPIH
jgi:hypothetical protein